MLLNQPRSGAAAKSASERGGPREGWTSAPRRAWARFRGALRVLKYALVIRRSGLFDRAFYVAQCGGTPSARRFPIFHYLLRGAAAGLDPSPLFDGAYYLTQYPDVAASGKNPFVHYLRRGLAEHRTPSARFEVADRLAHARDGGSAGADSPEERRERGGPALAGMRMTRAMRSGLERAAEFADSGRARRMLVIDQRVPTEDQDSASVRMMALLRLLRKLGHEITFVSDARRAGGRHERAVRQLGIDVLLGFDAAEKHLAAHGHEYRAALLSTPQAAERYLMAVRAYAMRAKVVYDTVDLHWMRFERGAAVTGDAVLAAEAARYRRIERLNARCADLTLTVTDAERDLLLREEPGARVEVLPNVHACPGTSRPWGARSGLMFIGAYSHGPNVDAVEWFVREILPRVHERLPGLVLRLVGGKVPRRVKRLASPTVRVLGHVPSVAPIFDAASVFVAPLRYGAGMKGKVGQSLAHGLPVVTTSIGAEGMMLRDGETALLADDPAAFADAVIRLAQDEALWTRLSRAGLRHVLEHLSEDAALERLAALFDVAPAEEPVAVEPLPAFARLPQ
jgi:Glycosyl transferases group 1